MPTDLTRIRIWCEDREQEGFARELFRTRFGVDSRGLSFNVAPAGKGAASQWVIRQSAAEVRRLVRATRSQQGLGFLVIADGDNVGWRQRFEAVVGRPDSRDPGDRLAVWTPTWSIETWVLYLCDEKPGGRAIDELTSYKTIAQRGNLSLWLGRAVQAWEPPRSTESDDVPSLAAARKELGRLLLLR